MFSNFKRNVAMAAAGIVMASGGALMAAPQAQAVTTVTSWHRCSFNAFHWTDVRAYITWSGAVGTSPAAATTFQFGNYNTEPIKTMTAEYWGPDLATRFYTFPAGTSWVPGVTWYQSPFTSGPYTSAGSSRGWQISLRRSDEAVCYASDNF